MQFFYQFPQRTERLVLVSSGGLGHEVSPLLRGAALPGAAPLLRLATQPPRARRAGGAGARLRDRGVAGRPPAGDRAGAAPARARGARQAFLETLRAVIDSAASASAPATASTCSSDPDPDRLGRARPHDPDRARPRGPRGDRGLPLRDPPRAAHFPHLEDPGPRRRDRDFVASTEPPDATTPSLGRPDRHPRRHRRCAARRLLVRLVAQLRVARRRRALELERLLDPAAGRRRLAAGLLLAGVVAVEARQDLELLRPPARTARRAG